MYEPEPTTSPDAEHRRHEILDLALAAADRRRRRRLAGRAGALAMIAFLLAMPLLLTRKSTPPAIVRKNTLPPVPPRGDSLWHVVLIPTDPTIAERLTIRPRPSRVVAIHDDELLAGLAQAHEPAGLAYVNGKAMLLFRQQPTP